MPTNDVILSSQQLVFPLSILPTNNQWGGLDRGCTLTKALYITEEDALRPADAKLRVFQCVLFLNKNFDQAIEWIKQHAYLPKSKGKFHVTGAGGLVFMRQLEAAFGVEVFFVDEFLTQIKGSFHLIKDIPEDEVCFPVAPLLDFGEILKPDMMKMTTKNIHDKLDGVPSPKDASSPFPVIMVFLGSGFGIVKIDENESGTVVLANTFGGKSFMGLARALLDTSSYDEIFELASRGSRSGVDTEVKDVIPPEALEKSYGKMPGDFPVFHFGKLGEPESPSLSGYRREDLAHAHVVGTVTNMSSQIIIACLSEGVRSVYVGGNMVKADLLRIEMANFINYTSDGVIETKFLRTGHTGAIGAMLSSEEYQKDFLQKMSLHGHG